MQRLLITSCYISVAISHTRTCASFSWSVYQREARDSTQPTNSTRVQITYSGGDIIMKLSKCEVMFALIPF